MAATTRDCDFTPPVISGCQLDPVDPLVPCPSPQIIGAEQPPPFDGEAGCPGSICGECTVVYDGNELKGIYEKNEAGEVVGCKRCTSFCGECLEDGDPDRPGIYVEDEFGVVCKSCVASFCGECTTVKKLGTPFRCDGSGSIGQKAGLPGVIVDGECHACVSESSYCGECVVCPEEPCELCCVPSGLPDVADFKGMKDEDGNCVAAAAGVYVIDRVTGARSCKKCVGRDGKNPCSFAEIREDGDIELAKESRWAAPFFVSSVFVVSETVSPPEDSPEGTPPSFMIWTGTATDSDDEKGILYIEWQKTINTSEKKQSDKPPKGPYGNICIGPEGKPGRPGVAPKTKPETCATYGYKDECSGAETPTPVEVTLSTGKVDGNGDPTYEDKTCYTCECSACSATVTLDINPWDLLGSDFAGDVQEYVDKISSQITVYLFLQNPDIQNDTEYGNYTGLTPTYISDNRSNTGTSVEWIFSGIMCNQEYYYAIDTKLSLKIEGSDAESNQSNVIYVMDCGDRGASSVRKIVKDDGVECYYVVINGELRKTLITSLEPWKLN